jgi:hypothetical protein
MSNVCPKGHFSSDPDYCSDCGARMTPPQTPPAQSALAVPSLPSGQSTDRCPDCGTHRPTGARYCEVCRFDFLSRTSFSGLTSAAPGPATVPAPQASPVPAVPSVLPAEPSPTAATAAIDPPSTTPSVNASAIRLLLRIVVDPSLYKDPDPEEPCPQGTPEKIFHLDLEENTVGRQYEGKGVHPEIVIGDPGISRRHVKFVRDVAGGFAALELGSINGTMLNGSDLEPGVLTPVKPGDQLTLGMWTRVHVEER